MKIVFFALLLSFTSFSRAESLEDIFLKADEDGKNECKVEVNKRLAKPSHKNTPTYVEMVEGVELDEVTLEAGDILYWKEHHCGVYLVQFSNTTTFLDYKWLGVDSIESISEMGPFSIYLHEKIFVPHKGLLGENIKKKGIEYKKWHYICLNKDGEPISTSKYSAQMFDLAYQGVHDYTCQISRGTLIEDTEIEGVVWKKGTSFKFDRNGKWVFVRVQPSQKYEGEIYKDGAKFFRGKHYSYKEDGSLEIFEPGDEGFKRLVE